MDDIGCYWGTPMTLVCRAFCFCPWKIWTAGNCQLGTGTPFFTRSDPSSPSLEVPGSYHPTFPAPSESFEGRAPLKSSREDPQRRSGESQEAKILNFSKIPAFSHHFPMLWMMCPYFVRRCQQLTGCFLLHQCSHFFPDCFKLFLADPPCGNDYMMPWDAEKNISNPNFKLRKHWIILQ